MHGLPTFSIAPIFFSYVNQRVIHVVELQLLLLLYSSVFSGKTYSAPSMIALSTPYSNVNAGNTKAAARRQRMKMATALAVYLWLHSSLSALAFLRNIEHMEVQRRVWECYSAKISAKQGENAKEKWCSGIGLSVGLNYRR